MGIRKEFWQLAWPAAAEGLLLMMLTAADLLMVSSLGATDRRNFSGAGGGTGRYVHILQAGGGTGDDGTEHPQHLRQPVRHLLQLLTGAWKGQPRSSRTGSGQWSGG